MRAGGLLQRHAADNGHPKELARGGLGVWQARHLPGLQSKEYNGGAEMKAETLICTKSNLRKIIKTNGSKYNNYTKREIVNDIDDSFKNRADFELYERMYTTAYTGTAQAQSYKLTIRNGAATLEDKKNGITYFLKEERRGGNGTR
jgi:hypothetical protein